MLCLLLNKIRDKGRTGSAWKRGEWEEREETGVGGRNGPNNLCTCELMNKKRRNINPI
jgi:hypothetical protein